MIIVSERKGRDAPGVYIRGLMYRHWEALW
jgi:hypothetical protein